MNINLDNIDFDSAADTINLDGSYLHQNNGLWGLYDFGESPDNPVVPYTFASTNELILWYFDDMGWDIHLYQHGLPLPLPLFQPLTQN